MHTGRGSNDSNDLYWGNGWYIWNNDGDRATLKNASGSVIDRCGYDGGGSVKNCWSASRQTRRSWLSEPVDTRTLRNLAKSGAMP